MIQKLRFKFVAVNMGIVTLMLCVILGLVFYFTRANLETESLSMMQTIAGRPFQLGVPGEPGSEVRLPYFTVRLGLGGERVAADGGYYNLSDDALLNDLVRAALSSPKTFGVIREYNLRYFRVDTPLDRCLVFADISSELATLNHLMRSCLFIGALSFLLFLGASILLSRWAVRPVELAWKQQRRFVADASHELKTPLAVILTNAELAQSPEYDQQSRQTFLASISTVARQMRSLIEQLLELARADDADLKQSFGPVDFSKLVSDALLPFEPVFFEKGLTLTARIGENIRVRGAGAALCQVLDALLDNAQKYAAPAGAAWVTLQKHGKSRCLLTVANQGPAIPPGQTEQIFKRFYRADPARSRTGSFGLGLSIAQSIVTRHRGRIWAESKNGVNYFYVELPCA